MTLAARLLVPVLIVLTGCGGAREKARDVAVTTFRVIDTPARYVRNRIDESEAGTTTTTTTTSQAATSDVVTPGRPVAPPDQRPVNAPPRTTTASTTTGGTTPAPRATPRASTTVAKPSSTPPAPASTPAAEFPTAKAVPDKPGFVLSPYDGAYVDVTGFKSGDKARDPKTRQIFIVP